MVWHLIVASSLVSRLLAGSAGAPEMRHAAYEAALAAHRDQLRAFEELHVEPYWRDVVAKRGARGDRPIASFTDADFVLTHPPVYRGRPEPSPKDFGLDLPPPLAEPSTIPRVETLEAAARRMYDFAPARVPEVEFKRRYAQVGLAAGLTREHILGVYAFETGGRGTHDMQAGIDPATGRGRPISTAIGYAQLLAANTVDMLSRSGGALAEALEREGHAGKAALVRRMAKDVVAVHGAAPSWPQAEAIAKQELGHAVHAINLDRDIGPRLQVMKLGETLQQYRTLAAKNGLPPGMPPPEVLEIMNLAGPRSGFAMAHPALADRLTVNFFTRGGYERNPVVQRLDADGTWRARTASELLARIREIMHGDNRRRDGAVEFARAFDEARAPAVGSSR